MKAGEVVDAKRARARRAISTEVHMHSLFGQRECSSRAGDEEREVDAHQSLHPSILPSFSPQISLEQVFAQRQGPPCLSTPRLSRLHAASSIACAPRCCPSRRRPVPCVKQRPELQPAKQENTCVTDQSWRSLPPESPPLPTSLPPSVCETSAVTILLPCLEHQIPPNLSAFIKHCELRAFLIYLTHQEASGKHTCQPV